MAFFDSLAKFVRCKRIELLIFAGMISVYFFAFFQRVAVPGTIFDELQQAFQIPAGMVTGLGAVYLYVYGAMQPAAGMLSDRFGAARIVVFGGLLISVGSILFPLSANVGMLYAMRVLIGIGCSLIYVSVLKEIDALFGAKHFVVFAGLTIFLGYSGGLFATLPFERIVRLVGWRAGLLGAGIACGMALGLVYFLFRRTGHLVRRDDVSRPSGMLWVLLKTRAIWPNLLVAIGGFPVYFLVQATLGKKFLTDYAGLNSALAAAFTGLMMLTTMTMALFGGFISRLLGNRRKPLLLAALGSALTANTVMLILVLLGNTSWRWFLPCYILLACGSIGSAPGSALIKELSPPSAVASAIGLLNGVCYLAVAMVTSIAGWIMDRFQHAIIRTDSAVIYPREAYAAVFLFCILLTLGSLAAAFFLRETRGKNAFFAAVNKATW